ncbi:hypothetical protein HETIRDRAFT_460682 [Heterobasidion irregulare TC 32-1]|uniref:Uncharacterized protein n=1 Tax=Heterobasidion irregulare (strain TC 32-1) TaxID=747525 RepID=W4JWT9_HETIT|nr:uncharacterized protein HETIRDRAFT_460682 [Heterobasidion irregulare TC 32-1]ETW77555.1 hypothetical protein HETIRDRAFT_460682 [Heterobasidion irregulare TC 32-1]
MTKGNKGAAPAVAVRYKAPTYRLSLAPNPSTRLSITLSSLTFSLSAPAAPAHGASFSSRAAASAGHFDIDDVLIAKALNTAVRRRPRRTARGADDAAVGGGGPTAGFGVGRRRAGGGPERHARDLGETRGGAERATAGAGSRRAECLEQGGAASVSRSAVALTETSDDGMDSLMATLDNLRAALERLHAMLERLHAMLERSDVQLQDVLESGNRFNQRNEFASETYHTIGDVPSAIDPTQARQWRISEAFEIWDVPGRAHSPSAPRTANLPVAAAAAIHAPKSDASPQGRSRGGLRSPLTKLSATVRSQRKAASSTVAISRAKTAMRAALGFFKRIIHVHSHRQGHGAGK